MSEQVIIRGVSGLVEGESFAIDRGETIIIGRSSACDVSLKKCEKFLLLPEEERLSEKHFQTVSRKHATIRISGGRIYLADLGSRNGTYLVKRDVLSMVDGGPVSPLQQVLIGDRKYRVIDLLSIASKFYGASAQATLVHPVRRDLAV